MSSVGLQEEWEQARLRGDSVLCRPAGGVGTGLAEGVPLEGVFAEW